MVAKVDDSNFDRQVDSDSRMGAQASKPDETKPQNSASAAEGDHYALLELEHSATSEEIKVSCISWEASIIKFDPDRLFHRNHTGSLL